MKNLDREYYNIAGIYQIKSITGKFYIGSSCNLYKRINWHLRQLKRNIHSNQHLQNHYNKHGDKVFTVKILEVVSKGDKYKRILIEREQYYLDKYYNKELCFNIHLNAVYVKNNPKLYKIHSNNMKEFWKNNRDKMLPIVIDNLKNINRSTIKHICWNKGKINCYSEETISKMSISAKNRNRDSYPIVTVFQYDKNGNFIKEWDSSKDAVEYYNKPITISSNITACCKNKRKSCIGFLWSYYKKINYYE